MAHRWTFSRWFLAWVMVASAATGLLVGVSIGLAYAASDPDPTAAASDSPDASIEALLEAHVRFAKERNAKALASLYTDPAEWVELTGAVSTLSRDEIEAQYLTALAVVTHVYDTYVRDVSITVSGDTATVEYTWYQDVENAVLGRVQSEGHNIWSLVRVNGNWLVAKAESRPIGVMGDLPFELPFDFPFPGP